MTHGITPGLGWLIGAIALAWFLPGWNWVPIVAWLVLHFINLAGASQFRRVRR